jgi:signal transduction histidine kinase
MMNPEQRLPEQRLFCQLDGLSPAAREQQRSRTLQDLRLLKADSLPVFEEATQMATHFLDLPIGILGIMTPHEQTLKSAVGLSRLGSMNEWAKMRRYPRLETFCAYVVDSHQPLSIPDTFAHPAFERSKLVHQYGIRAYLGVPMMTANGCCVGTLAVMDQHPREFTQRDIEFLQLTARWSMSEFERQQASQRSAGAAAAAPAESLQPPTQPPAIAAVPEPEPDFAHTLKLELLAQLTQELRTPLTAVMGMANVLMQEIYGPLTSKQKEYLHIIHNSGHSLLSLVNEILELSALPNTPDATLRRVAVEIEMLSQQVVGTLEQVAHRRDQNIRLSVEPGHHLWFLDREKVRQMLYHLVFSVIQSSNSGSTVRLHISRKHGNLHIAVWVSHPWLGEGLTHTSQHIQSARLAARRHEAETEADRSETGGPAKVGGVALQEISAPATPSPPSAISLKDRTCSDLGLLLCQQLAEWHGGHLTIQEGAASGARYVVVLPQSTGSDQASNEASSTNTSDIDP